MPSDVTFLDEAYNSPPSRPWSKDTTRSSPDKRYLRFPYFAEASSSNRIPTVSCVLYQTGAERKLLYQTHTMPIGQEESGATAGVKFVTSTIGNTVGGVTNTVGGVVGALGRGVGETIEGATGSAGRPVARGLADATTSIEDGANRVAGGVKRAGEGK